MTDSCGLVGMIAASSLKSRPRSARCHHRYPRYADSARESEDNAPANLDVTEDEVVRDSKGRLIDDPTPRKLTAHLGSLLAPLPSLLCLDTCLNEWQPEPHNLLEEHTLEPRRFDHQARTFPTVNGGPERLVVSKTPVELDAATSRSTGRRAWHRRRVARGTGLLEAARCSD